MENLFEAAAQALVKFKVVKPFTLTHDDHTKEHFVPGDYERPAHIAFHWFVQAHTDNPPPDALAIGSPQHAVAMRALVAKRRQLLQEAEEAYNAALEEGQKVFGYTEAAALPTQAPNAPLTDTGGDALAEVEPTPPAADATQEDGEQIPIARRKTPPQE
jgi:hypothetical protein